MSGTPGQDASRLGSGKDSLFLVYLLLCPHMVFPQGTYVERWKERWKEEEREREGGKRGRRREGERQEGVSSPIGLGHHSYDLT